MGSAGNCGLLPYGEAELGLTSRDIDSGDNEQGLGQCRGPHGMKMLQPSWDEGKEQGCWQDTEGSAVIQPHKPLLRSGNSSQDVCWSSLWECVFEALPMLLTDKSVHLNSTAPTAEMNKQCPLDGVSAFFLGPELLQLWLGFQQRSTTCLA